MKTKDQIIKTIRIEPDMFDKIERLAIKNKRSFNFTVNELLQKSLSK